VEATCLLVPETGVWPCCFPTLGGEGTRGGPGRSPPWGGPRTGGGHRGRDRRTPGSPEAGGRAVGPVSPAAEDLDRSPPAGPSRRFYPGLVPPPASPGLPGRIRLGAAAWSPGGDPLRGKNRPGSPPQTGRGWWPALLGGVRAAGATPGGGAGFPLTAAPPAVSGGGPRAPARGAGDGGSGSNRPADTPGVFFPPLGFLSSKNGDHAYNAKPGEFGIWCVCAAARWPGVWPRTLGAGQPPHAGPRAHLGGVLGGARDRLEAGGFWICRSGGPPAPPPPREGSFRRRDRPAEPLGGMGTTPLVFGGGGRTGSGGPECPHTSFTVGGGRAGGPFLRTRGQGGRGAFETLRFLRDGGAGEGPRRRDVFGFWLGSRASRAVRAPGGGDPGVPRKNGGWCPAGGAGAPCRVRGGVPFIRRVAVGPLPRFSILLHPHT
jgi:hypothetical protein